MGGIEGQQRQKKLQPLTPLLPIRRYQIQIIGFYQTFKEIYYQLLIGDNICKKENLPNSFYMSKLDKDKTKK